MQKLKNVECCAIGILATPTIDPETNFSCTVGIYSKCILSGFDLKLVLALTKNVSTREAASDSSLVNI